MLINLDNIANIVSRCVTKEVDDDVAEQYPWEVVVFLENKHRLVGPRPEDRIYTGTITTIFRSSSADECNDYLKRIAQRLNNLDNRCIFADETDP